MLRFWVYLRIMHNVSFIGFSAFSFLFNLMGKRVNSFKRLLPETDGVRYDEYDLMKPRQCRQLTTWSSDALKRVQNINDYLPLQNLRKSFQKLEGILE